MSDPAYTLIPPALAERMTALSRSFPSLEKAAGVAPFDPVKLADLYRETFPGDPTMATAAQLVLLVFRNESAGLDCRAYLEAIGKAALGDIDAAALDFNIIDARDTFDPAHRAALATWILNGAGTVAIIDPVPPSPH